VSTAAASSHATRAEPLGEVAHRRADHEADQGDEGERQAGLRDREADGTGEEQRARGDPQPGTDGVDQRGGGKRPDRPGSGRRGIALIEQYARTVLQRV
jgi:hypothetical protein